MSEKGFSIVLHTSSAMRLKKVLSLWLQLLPLSTGDGGGGRFAENWWLTLTQGFIEEDLFPHHHINRLCLPVGLIGRESTLECHCAVDKGRTWTCTPF